MSYSIRWFVNELIECYWRFVNCRGSYHQRQMEQEMLNTLDIKLFFILKICIHLCFCLRSCRRSQHMSLCNNFK